MNVKKTTLIAKILPPILALSLLASCKPSEDDIASAKNMTAAVFDEIASGNGLSNSNQYISADTDDYMDTVDKLNIRKIIEESGAADEQISALKAFMGEEQTQEYIDKVIQKTLSLFSYTISNSETDGNKIIVYADVEYPVSFDKSVFDDMDEEDVITQIFGTSDLMGIVNTFMQRKNITIDQIQSIYGNDNELMMKDICEVFAPEIQAYMDNMLDKMCENAEMETYQAKVTFEKVSGDWKITDID